MTANHVECRRRPILRPISFVIAIAIASASFSTASHAVGSSEQQAACGGDVMRFCLSAYPNMERLKECMTKNRNNLSSKCRAVLEKG